MSNLSILRRLEDSLAAYSNGTLARGVFIAFLSNSICALEGVALSVTHELREHEYAIETESYFDDEGFEYQQNLAQESLFDWIQELKRIYEARGLERGEVVYRIRCSLPAVFLSTRLSCQLLISRPLFFNLMFYKAALRLNDLSLRTTQAFITFPGRQWRVSAG